jgi:alpha-L-arabinofuranosidase
VDRARLLLSLGLALCLTLSGCVNDAAVVAADTTLRVNPSQRVAPVGDLIGAVMNEHYWSPKDSVHPDWASRYLGRTVEPVRALAPTNGRPFAVRFGHTPTDGRWGGSGYHWQTALDEREWATSIDEAMEYIGLVGGKPHVGVNFGSGTAAEAARFVAYTNGTDDADPNVQLRIQRGRPEPYGVKHWVIGFEQYGNWETGFGGDRPFDFANPEALNGGDPAWFGKPSSDPTNFGARAAEFARAMRRASPTPIHITVPANNWDLQYWGGPNASLQAILSTAGPDIDAVSVHFYPGGATYGEGADNLLGRTETLDSKLESLQLLLTKFAPQGKSIGIEDVEYNNRASSDGLTHEFANGLFVADTLRVLANRGVGSAFYFAISNAVGDTSGFSYFEKGMLETPMPTYFATQLVAGHIGTDVVSAEVAGSRVLEAAGGKAGAMRYPSVTVLASLAADRKTLYLVVINKHPLMDQSVDIQLGGARVDASAGVLTTLTRDGMAPLACRVGDRFTCTFPAYSLTGIRLPLRAAVALP